jgi:transcription-repair coupling factor (superfamily II helicase)
LGLRALGAIRITPFNEPEGEARKVIALEARAGTRWAKAGEAEGEERINVFDAAVATSPATAPKATR